MKELKSYISSGEVLSIRKQCELIDVPRSSVYYLEAGESQEKLEIMALMDKEFMDHPTLYLSH